MSNNDYYIGKWKFLLDGLSEKKSLKAKYAKIYEKSSLNNDFQYFKLIIAILYKLFQNVEDFNSSNSKKNKIEIGRQYEYALFDQGVILIDAFEYFVQQTIEKAIKEFPEKFNYLRINKEDDMLVVYLVYWAYI